jgi:Tfp pilus assembly protein PilO
MDLKNYPWYGQIGIFLIVSAILFGGFYYMYLSDVIKAIDITNRESETLQISINNLKNKLKELEQIKAEIAMNEKTLKVLDQILPTERTISDILKNIQSLISVTQQEFKRMSSGTKKVKKLFIEYSYTINAAGNYHNLGTFFDQLSNLKKIFNVTSLTISPLKGKVLNPQFTINASFRLSTYIQKKNKSGRRK